MDKESLIEGFRQRRRGFSESIKKYAIDEEMLETLTRKSDEHNRSIQKEMEEVGLDPGDLFSDEESEKDEIDENVEEVSNVAQDIKDREIEKFLEDAFKEQKEYINTLRGSKVSGIAGGKMTQNFQNVLMIVNKQQMVIAELRKENEMLKKLEVTKSKTVATYAEMAQKGPKASTPKTDTRQRVQNVGSIFIYPKKEMNSSDTKKNLQELVDPKDVEIKNVRKIRKGGILVQLKDKDDEKKFLETLKSSKRIVKEYNIEQQKKLNPKIILYDVMDKSDPEDVTKKILSQNSDIKEGDLRYVTRYKGKDGYNYIFEIKSQTFRNLDKKKIKIGWVSHPIKEYLRPVRCFKCNSFGHISKYCKAKERCMNCGDENHKKEQCKNEIICINCKTWNLKYKTNFSIEHCCTDKNCKIYEKEILKLRNRTDYG